MALRNIGISLELIKLSAADYLGKPIDMASPMSSAAKKTAHLELRRQVEGHSDSICYATLLRRDRTHYRADIRRSE